MTGPTAPPPPVARPPEEERLPYGRLVAVLIATLVIFSGAVLWARSILVGESGRVLPTGGAPAREVGEAEIGIVDQEMFDRESRAERLRQEQRRHLDSYGWMDRDAGVIHIPIQRAMDEVISGLARERGGGAP
jgi:hypothetical protein